MYMYFSYRREWLAVRREIALTLIVTDNQHSVKLLSLVINQVVKMPMLYGVSGITKLLCNKKKICYAMWTQMCSSCV